MSIAIHPTGAQANDPPIQQKPLSFDEFLARYGSDNCYELIDGEVFDWEPTGLHEEVAANHYPGAIQDSRNRGQFTTFVDVDRSMTKVVDDHRHHLSISVRGSLAILQMIAKS